MEDNCMNIKIHSLRFSADKKLEDFIETRIEKLGRHQDRIIGAEVILRLDKSHDTENKVAEIKIEIPGSDIFAKKQSRSFEAATDLAVDALKRQLKKYKEKSRSK